MSEESNVCAICGGMKRIEYVIGFEEGRPHDMRVESPSLLPEGGWRLCPGHPEPVTAHDGFLDEKREYEVSWWQKQSEAPRIYIEETSTVKDEPEFVGITPAQALSLLAWLKQEEPELQRLAKAGGSESPAEPAS